MAYSVKSELKRLTDMVGDGMRHATLFAHNNVEMSSILLGLAWPILACKH